MPTVLEWCRRSKDLERTLEEYPDLAKDYEERKKKYRVGFFRTWTPEFLQAFRSPVYFTTVMFVFALLEGALVSGLTSVVLSSIERRYKFTSTMTGLIASTFDIIVILLIVPVSYFGGRGNTPRWLAAGAIIHGIGSIVFSLPQFVGGAYLPSLQGQNGDFCEVESDFSPSCEDSGPSWVFFIFILGATLMGIGASPLFTIGTAFLDNISWPKKSSIYIGLFYIATVLGPALGSGLGGAFLSLFVDPLTNPSELNLQETDPAFVGAWWLGFLLIGILVVTLAVPILIFPRELPEGELIRRERSKDMVLYFTDASKDKGLKGDLKEAPKHFLQVFSSPTWFFSTLALAFQALSVTGFIIFGPKFLEVQYRVSSSLASFIMGAIGVGGAVLGTAFGTVILYFLKSTGRRAAIIVLVTCFMSTVFAVGFLFSCPNALVPGPQNNGSAGFLLTGDPVGNLSCSDHCSCTTTVYTPVCDVGSGLTYFSPCHAGCPNTTQGDVHTNCTCASLTVDTSYGPVVEGKCDNQCTFFAATVVLLLLFLSSAFMGGLGVPGLVVIMRTVAEEQRALALGIQSIAYRIIGTISGSLIFGAIFDSTCILWKYECGERGNCWEYSNPSLTLRLFLVGLLTSVASFVFMLLGVVWYGRDWCFRKVLTENSKTLKTSQLQMDSPEIVNQQQSPRILLKHEDPAAATHSDSEEKNSIADRTELHELRMMNGPLAATNPLAV